MYGKWRMSRIKHKSELKEAITKSISDYFNQEFGWVSETTVDEITTKLLNDIPHIVESQRMFDALKGVDATCQRERGSITIGSGVCSNILKLLREVEESE